jgi:serine/threonine-protein kinase RIO1
MLDTTIHTGDAAVVYLADALSRVRALTETESRILHRALRRDAGMFRRWTAAEDAKLLKMHKAGIRAPGIAMTLGRSSDAVRRRLCDLKKGQRCG